MFLFERLYSRTWACLGILFTVCIVVNVMFWGRFPIHSFSKSQLYTQLGDMFVGTTNNIPSTTINLKPDLRPESTFTNTSRTNIQRIPVKVTDKTTEKPTTMSTKISKVAAETEKPTVTVPVKNNTIATKNVNEFDFKYTINVPDICKTPPVLIIVVCTAVKNNFPRVGVRSTWGSPEILNRTNSSLVFLVGQVKSKLLQEKLEDESRKYHDIVQADFVDSYQNLSVKSVALLNWVKTFCSGSKYVLKADDDMYVNIPNLIKAMATITQPKFILGHVFQGAKPIQDKRSKWYTPLKDYSEKFYPKYVSGTTYAMTTNVASDLYKASLEIKTFWLEDVYITGLLARKAGVPRFHNPQFHYETSPDTGCAFREGITGHRYHLATMLKIHRELYSGNLTCPS